MNFCANVSACSRPNYLYVALDSIFRNTIVPDVYVYIDIMDNGSNCIEENSKVVSNFPVKDIIISDKHEDTANQLWKSFNKSFELGYDYAIYLEEDWLLTTNAFEWFIKCPKENNLYSLYRWSDRIGFSDSDTVLNNGEFISWCIATDKINFDLVYSFRQSDKLDSYLAQWPEFNKERLLYHDWDRVFIMASQEYGFTQRVPSKSLLAHFGNISSIDFGYGAGIDMPDIMFSGDKETWLGNIVNIFNTSSKEQLDSYRLAPTEGFIYG